MGRFQIISAFKHTVTLVLTRARNEVHLLLISDSDVEAVLEEPTNQIIHSPPRGVSREWGVALYSAYAVDVTLDSSALKDAVVAIEVLF